MSRLASVRALVAALACAAVVVPLTATAGSVDAAAAKAFLKEQVFTVPGKGAVAVGMPNPRTVTVRYRPEGRTFSEPSVFGATPAPLL